MSRSVWRTRSLFANTKKSKTYWEQRGAESFAQFRSGKWLIDSLIYSDWFDSFDWLILYTDNDSTFIMLALNKISQDETSLSTAQKKNNWFWLDWSALSMFGCAIKHDWCILIILHYCYFRLQSVTRARTHTQTHTHTRVSNVRQIASIKNTHTYNIQIDNVFGANRNKKKPKKRRTYLIL